MPYYEPVAPIVPDAQKNQAPGLILQGLQQGFAAVMENNQQMRASELALQQMAARERLAEQESQLDREKLAINYELGKEHNRLQGIYYEGLRSTKDINSSRAEERFYNWQEDQRRKAVREKSQLNFDNKALAEAEKSKLFNAEFWASEPVLAADAYLDWKGRFGSAVEGQVPLKIKEWDALADQTKLPVRTGSEWQEGYYKTEQDGSQRYIAGGWVGGGDLERVPAWKLLQKWKHEPDARADIQKALAAGGNIQTITELKKIDGKEMKVNHKNFDPTTQRYLGQAAKAKFLPGKSEVPEELKYKKAAVDDLPANGATDSGLPQSSIDEAAQRMDTESSIPVEPPTLPDTSMNAAKPLSFESTETEKRLAQAKAALSHGAPPAAVAARLRDFKIDPSQLWA